jgi:hypothetical protein
VFVLDAITIAVKERDPESERALVGQWVVPTKTGSSWETYTFSPDGTYVYSFESSHTGQIKNYLGELTATWGTANQNGDRGRWQIRGDLLVLFGTRGEQIYVFALGHNGRCPTLKVVSANFIR